MAAEREESAETTTVTVTVNGTRLSATVEARLLLVELLRDVHRLTGTKIGCDTSTCGACTVLVDGKATKSCTLLAAQAHGAEVRTIEGLATAGDLHPVQRAFHEHHGLQCGYCTPGMIMASVSLLQESPRPTEEEVRLALKGNVCRCTGYQQIVDAVIAAAAELEDAP